MNEINLVPGQTILIELEEECLLGKILHIGSGKSFIRMSNVRDVATRTNLGIQTYYHSEIRSIQIVAADNNISQPSDLARSDDSLRAVEDGAIKYKQLSLSSLNELFEQINRYVFIHQTDIKYHDSIRFLKNQRYFGIAMEGVQNGRHSKSPSLLTISTFESIYIFDIKWVKITEDIRDLLTNERYRRVIHNERLIRDALQHKYNISLGKCFDAMVAHIAISKSEGIHVDNVIPLQTCVASYLKIPEKFFNSNVCYESRPLNDEAKQEAAKNVVFLLPLQELFIHEIMLEPFYHSCRKYSHSLSSNPDFINSLTELQDNDCSALEMIEPNILGVDLSTLNISENAADKDS